MTLNRLAGWLPVGQRTIVMWLRVALTNDFRPPLDARRIIASLRALNSIGKTNRGRTVVMTCARRRSRHYDTFVRFYLWTTWHLTAENAATYLVEAWASVHGCNLARSKNIFRPGHKIAYTQ